MDCGEEVKLRELLVRAVVGPLTEEAELVAVLEPGGGLLPDPERALVVDPGELGGKEPGDFRKFNFARDNSRWLDIGRDRSSFGMGFT